MNTNIKKAGGVAILGMGVLLMVMMFYDASLPWPGYILSLSVIMTGSALLLSKDNIYLGSVVVTGSAAILFGIILYTPDNYLIPAVITAVGTFILIKGLHMFWIYR